MKKRVLALLMALSMAVSLVCPAVATGSGSSAEQDPAVALMADLLEFYEQENAGDAWLVLAALQPDAEGNLPENPALPAGVVLPEDLSVPMAELFTDLQIQAFGALVGAALSEWSLQDLFAQLYIWHQSAEESGAPDYTILKDALAVLAPAEVEVAEPEVVLCDVCQTENCAAEHVFCEEHQVYDCAENHEDAAESVLCDICQAENCTEEHVFCEEHQVYDCAENHEDVAEPVLCDVCRAENCSVEHVFCEEHQVYDCAESHEVVTEPEICADCLNIVCTCEKEPAPVVGPVAVCEECAGEAGAHAKTCTQYVKTCTCTPIGEVHMEGCDFYEPPVLAPVPEPVGSLYDQLMAAEDVAAMYAVVLDYMENDPVSLMDLTAEEISDLQARVNELDPEGDDTDTADLLDTLAILPNGGEQLEGEPEVLVTTTSGTWQGARLTSDSKQELGSAAVVTMRKLTEEELANRKQNANFVVPAGVTFTMKGHGSFARAADNMLSLVYVEKGGKLIIEGTSKEQPLIIDGKNVIANTPLIVSEGDVEMKNAVIQNGKNRSVNTSGSPNGAGGGIQIKSTGSLTMENCVVTKNTSSVNGGGIQCQGTMTISNSTISYNRAASTETGPGVVNAGRGGGFNLTGATATGTLTNVIVENNAAMYYGGGGQIQSSASLTMEEGTIFRNNTAILHGAGALHVTADAKFTMNGGSMENNSAQTVGGAIHSSYSCVLNLNKGEISNNTANGRGGGVHVNTGGNITLGSGLTISGNTANDEATGSAATMDATGDNWSGVEKNGTHSNNGYGGGVLIDSGTCTVEGATITDNSAAVGGGGIALVMLNVSDSGLDDVLVVNFTMNSGNISGNTTAGNGAGVYLMTNKAKENIISVHGEEGSEGYLKAIAKLKDQNILTDEPVAEINGGTVSGNNADNNGGGLYLGEKTKFIINAGSVSENKAVNGAGVYVASGTAEINGGTMSGNIASGDGGALYVSGTATMADGAISGNKAAQNGGALYITGGDFTMTSGSMTENRAKGTSGEAGETGYGGGVYVNGGSITIGVQACTGNETNHDSTLTEKTHPVVRENYAKDSGGGLAIIGDGSLTMHCGDISDNEATNRGRGENAYMENGTFTRNAGSVGDVDDPGIVIVGGTLDDNTENEKKKVNLWYHHCNDNLDTNNHRDDKVTKIADATENAYFNLPDGEKYWTAAPGFRFFGWTFYGPNDANAKKNVRCKEDYKPLGAPVQSSDIEEVGVPQGTYDGEKDDIMNLYALWAPDVSDITYVGSVVEGIFTEETLSETGNPDTYNFTVGSNEVTFKAPVKKGYTFTGWYFYQDLDQNANWGYEPVFKADASGESYDNLDFTSSDFKFFEAGADGKVTIDMGDTYFGDVTMIAKFEPAVSGLKIIKNVEGEVDENQSFIFDVKGYNDDDDLIVDMVVTIQGEGEVTLTNLPVGYYVATERTDWSWRYTLTKAEAKNKEQVSILAGAGSQGAQNYVVVELERPTERSVVEFTNERTNDYWLSGEAFAVNKWTTNIIDTQVASPGTVVSGAKEEEGGGE